MQKVSEIDVNFKQYMLDNYSLEINTSNELYPFYKMIYDSNIANKKLNLENKKNIDSFKGIINEFEKKHNKKIITNNYNIDNSKTYGDDQKKHSKVFFG